jgi:uncharacterized linocin/CFP29 family protein
MNHLLRSHAPISDEVWSELDDEARERLAPALAARRLVDFRGPFGWEYSSSNLGRVRPLEGGPADGVRGLQRKVLALIELRADFALSRDELRVVSLRGATSFLSQGKISRLATTRTTAKWFACISRRASASVWPRRRPRSRSLRDAS